MAILIDCVLPFTKQLWCFRPREPDASQLSPTYSDIDYTDDDLVSCDYTVYS